MLYTRSLLLLVAAAALVSVEAKPALPPPTADLVSVPVITENYQDVPRHRPIKYVFDLKKDSADDCNAEEFNGQDDLVFSDDKTKCMVVSGKPGIFDEFGQVGPMYTDMFGVSCADYNAPGTFCVKKEGGTAGADPSFLDCADPKASPFGELCECKKKGYTKPYCIAEKADTLSRCSGTTAATQTLKDLYPKFAAYKAPPEKPCDVLAEYMAKTKKGYVTPRRAFCIGKRSKALLVCPDNKVTYCNHMCVSLFEDEEMTKPCGKAACAGPDYKPPAGAVVEVEEIEAEAY